MAANPGCIFTGQKRTYIAVRNEMLLIALRTVHWVVRSLHAVHTAYSEVPGRHMSVVLSTALLMTREECMCV